MKNTPANAGGISDVGLISGLGRYFLPGESLEQRSLAGYSPWGCKETDMTEVT